MLPDEEELKEFVKEIPKTPLGKLEAMNKVFFKEKNLEEAFRQMHLMFTDLMRNNPNYFEALKDCKTEEEIKQKTGEFCREDCQVPAHLLPTHLNHMKSMYIRF